MNRDQIAGNWQQVKGRIKEKWGQLTDDDMTEIEGRADVMAGKIQERYGIAREEAERQVEDFFGDDEGVDRGETHHGNAARGAESGGTEGAGDRDRYVNDPLR